MFSIAIRLVCIVVFFIGCWQAGQGVYLYGKAWLAQYLLQSAWNQSKASLRIVKPWSWADTWPIGRLMRTNHQEDIIILAGDSGRTLAFGPGHQFGTPLPGEPGNSIISAHRDTHFNFLQYLSVGDDLSLETLQKGTIRLQVIEATVIDVNSTEIRIDTGTPLITLVTCYPFNAVEAESSLRYMVLLEVLTEPRTT